jgi:phosphohistidine phosphatase
VDLILWRHCDAEPGEPDVARRLTAKGVRQAERMALWLDRRVPATCRVLVSPAERCQQTAQALNRRFSTVADLAPGASPRAVLAAAGWPESREAVLVVAHQPTLGEVVSTLLTGREAFWAVKKGAVWWLASGAQDSGAAVVVKAVLAPDFV